MSLFFKLITQIRSVLVKRESNSNAENLAAEYTRLASEASERLDTCAAMIARSGEYQALQLAEAEPPLLDVLAALSFAEAPQWLEFCEMHGLPVPPKIDPKAIQALDRLYAHGITASHPLYKDYRAAVSSRNDAKALQVIRSIARLNPEDASARSELARWENKFFQLQLVHLREALAGGEEQNIVRSLGELERVGRPEKLSELPEYLQASAIRRQTERTEAIDFAEGLAASLAAEREKGDWRAVGSVVGRIRALQQEYAFQISPASAALCAEMQSYYEAERAAAETQSHFAAALEAVRAMAVEIEQRFAASPPMTLLEAEALYSAFGRLWTDAEEFKRPVEDDLRERIRTGAARLRAEIEKLQRRRQTKRIALAAAAVFCAVGAAWWAVRTASSVRERTRQLGELQSAGLVEPAEKMIAHLRSDEKGLASDPALKARIDETDRWTHDERAKLAHAESRLAELEKAASGHFAESDPKATSDQITLVKQLLESLPAGLRPATGNRLSLVKNEFDGALDRLHATLSADSERELSQLEAIASAGLSYDQSREAIAVALERISPQLQALEARLRPPLPALQIPSDLETRIIAVRKRFDLLTREVGLIREINEGLLQASTLEAYEKTLEQFKDSRLTQDPEVSNARTMLATFPKADEVLQALLMPGEPGAWNAVKEDASGDAFTPGDVHPDELGRFMALREDNYLNDIWEIAYTDYTRKASRHDGYSRGELKRDGPRDTGEGQMTSTWTGQIFDPTLKTELPAFVPATFTRSSGPFGASGNGEVTSSRRSAVSECLAQMELNRMTDETGNKYEKPLLALFDDIVQAKSANPIFKAYMMQALAGIMDERPYAWGLEFCPSLRNDLAKLSEVCGGASFRSADWLVERKRSQFTAGLTPYFAALHGRSYLAEARQNRSIIQSARKAGLRFGGYLDAARTPYVLGEALTGNSLWATLEKQRTVSRIHPVVPPKPELTFAPFSPVFFIPLDRPAAVNSGPRPTASIPVLDP